MRPPERERYVRARGDVPPLARAGVRVEDQALRVDPLQQHDPARRAAVRAHGRERHPGRVGDRGSLLRPLQELDESRDRIHIGSLL